MGIKIVGSSAPPIPARIRLKVPPRPARFWSAHTHSVYSAQDALPQVAELVSAAKGMGQRALGLTDHGNMAGSVELYNACMKAGMRPFPGSELYLVPDTAGHRKARADKTVKASRFHLGVLAYSFEGYQNLVNLSTATHHNHFHKPLADFALLAELADAGKTRGLAVTTGCYFGYAVQQLVTQGEHAAKRFLSTLDSWFPGSTYVEIQNHQIDHEDGWNDDLVADALVSLADDLGLPVVITQDAHYLAPRDKEDHDALKRLVAFGPEPDDAVFPGDGFHLADDRWIETHHGGAGSRRLERGLEGLDDLLGRHELRVPVLDTYRYSVPLTVPDPEAVLRERCRGELERRGLTSPRYGARLGEELDVVTASRMAGYLLLVADVTDYLDSSRVLFQTRGSAAGSLICWLLGITQHDPLVWGLMFERFLSKDRTKPPDIDLDIQHDHREGLINWLNTRFSVHQIGSWQEMGMTSEGEDDSKGSLLVKYYSSQRKQDTGITTWEQVPPRDRGMLHRLANHQTFSGPGTNAAGLTITSSRTEFDSLVPVMYMTDTKVIAKHRMVSQYDLNGIENLGLVKLDVLGSKTLTVLRRTVDLLPDFDLTAIPLSESSTYRFIRSGKTDGVFQLEGGSTKRGVRELKPTSIKDVIAAMALFRPATMKSKATDHYIARKHKLEVAPVRHEIIHRHTKATYGILLFQEQVIAVLRDLGMNADDLTSFLKAIKASNANIGNAGEVIAGFKSHINSLCTTVGMTQADMDWLDEAFAAYSGYGFNSAHATVYGITAYRCAYLVVHHPLEFHTALLAVAAEGNDRKKEDRYLKATISRGIRILKADVNVSGSTYTLDPRRRAIRRGLRSVPGVGASTALELERHQPFSSLQDLCERVDHTKVTGVMGYRELGDRDVLTGTLEKLHVAGALDSLV